MLNKITCDTDVNTIIKDSDVIPYLNQLEDLIFDSVYSIKRTINEEQSSRGLSISAFSIDNHSILLDKSNAIVDNIDLDKSFYKFKEDVLNNLMKQRKLEIDMLKMKVNEKLDQLNKEYKSTVSILKEIASSIVPNSTSSLYYNNQKARINSEIEKYRNKLNVLEGMI